MAGNSLQPQVQVNPTDVLVYSKNVIARVEDGELNRRTAAVAQVLCSGLNFPADGQRELQQSVDRIRGLTKFHKYLYFGLGHKSIVYDLLQTEHGAATVAISAALASYHTPAYAAQVWDEICRLRADENLQRPSIAQWGTFTSVCAPTLEKSRFKTFFDIYSRILAPRSTACRSPPPAAEFAKALGMLLDLTTNPVSDTVILVGGVECAWLAAFARCFLCLTIEVLDERNLVRDQWRPLKTQGPIQVRFWPETNETRRKSNSSSIRMVHVIPSGEEILRMVHLVPSGEEFSHRRIDLSTPTVRFRSQWSSVFADAFQSSWHDFIQSPCSRHCGDLLHLVAECAAGFFSSSSRLSEEHMGLPWWLYWHPGKVLLFHHRRTGRTLLHFLESLLPELRKIAPGAQTSRLDRRQSLQAMTDLERKLSESCHCELCGKSKTSETSQRHCFKRLALTVIRVGLILSPVSVDLDTPLSPHALCQMYNCLVEPENLHPDLNLPLYGVELTLYLFTGHYSPGPSSSAGRRITAASCGTTCAYLLMLTRPSCVLEDVTGIQVAPGEIRHHNSLYRRVVDMDDETSDTGIEIMRWTSETGLRESFGRGVELVAEEIKNDPSTLAVSFTCLLTGGRRIVVRPGETDAYLRSEFRFHICACRESSALRVDDKQYRWSSKKASSAMSEPDQDGRFRGARPNSYFLLSWSTWELRPAHHTHEARHYEVEVYRGDLRSLICLRELLLLDPRMQINGIASGVIMIPTCCGVDCVARVIISTASRRNALAASHPHTAGLLHRPQTVDHTPDRMIVKFSPSTPESDVGCFMMDVWEMEESKANERMDRGPLDWLRSAADNLGRSKR